MKNCSKCNNELVMDPQEPKRLLCLNCGNVIIKSGCSACNGFKMAPKSVLDARKKHRECRAKLHELTKELNIEKEISEYAEAIGELEIQHYLHNCGKYSG